MHRCFPWHSGWKSQTAGLAYVQTPVLCLFKYIVRDVLCTEGCKPTLCYHRVWSRRKIILWRSQCTHRLALPRGALQMVLLICEETNQLPSTNVMLALSVPQDSESLTWNRFRMLQLPWDSAAHLNQEAACMYKGLEVVLLFFLALQSVWNRGTSMPLCFTFTFTIFHKETS